jgi:DNA-binding NtrC family response regulator
MVRLMACEPTGKTVKKTILLAEDDACNRDIMAEILADSGYRVLPVADGASALSAIQEHADIDLVITDYCMPDMNGLDLALALRQMRPVVPIIMVTGYGSIENYFKSMSLGVFEYVNKPLKKIELERMVKLALHDLGTDANG